MKCAAILQSAIIDKIKEITAEVDAMLQPRENNVINQIKEFRAMTGFGLLDSKNIVQGFHQLKKVEFETGGFSYEHDCAIIDFNSLVGAIVDGNFYDKDHNPAIENYRNSNRPEPVVPQLVLFNMNNKARYYRASSALEAQNFSYFIEQENGYIVKIVPDPDSD